VNGTLIGLCVSCRHARPVTSARGSTFWRCALNDQDARFPKYPRLPVLVCDGYVGDDTEARPGRPSGGDPDHA